MFSCARLTMTGLLTRLGWNDRLDKALAAHGADGFVPGRVALEHTHIYRVMTEAGESLARVSGRLRHQASNRADFPAVGDWVVLASPEHGGDARIVAVLPRQSRFSRRAAGDPTEEQVVAANIDTVFLVAGLDGDFNPRRVERYLSWLRRRRGAVIVLNRQTWPTVQRRWPTPRVRWRKPGSRDLVRVPGGWTSSSSIWCRPTGALLDRRASASRPSSIADRP